MFSIKKTLVIGFVLWIALGLSIQSSSGPIWPQLVARSDQDYAIQLHRSLLGREPGRQELATTVEDLERASHRLMVHNRILDSLEFKMRVGDDEFLVGLYAQLMGRRPLAHEMLIGRHFLEETFPRSQVLGQLIQLRTPVRPVTANTAPLYENLVLDFTPQALRRYQRVAQAFAAQDADSLHTQLQQEAQQLAGAEPGSPDIWAVSAGPEADPEYNIYYGYIHAHTWVSWDALVRGSPGPFEAFDYARNVAGLDYLGLSDHSEFIVLWPWFDPWDYLQSAVDAHNEDGAFVALRGFEFSNPLFGHFCVYGTPDFTSAWSALTQQLFYAWLAQYPDAVATFNHPGAYDWDFLPVEFLHFEYFPDVAQQVMGIELLTHNDDYSDYSVGYVAEDGLGYMDEANNAGWRIASVSAQDNHSGGWGTTDDYRTAVLALDLTQASVLDSLRHRRYYSTQDKNLIMSFRADGHEMGAVLPWGDKTFAVTLDDSDGEGFALIDFYANGRLVESREVDGVGSWDFVVAAPDDPSYYYALVTQQDGDQAMSAPIWVQGPQR